jgi:LmbE family N-acetylglucosaminyl deacetylase
MMLRLAPTGRDPLRVLCLGAHSDDIEIGCGGTILTLLDQERDVHVDWVVFSATGQREDEAKAGADSFLAGAASSSVTIHPFRDGFFPWEGAAIKEVFEALKSGEPDVVFTHQRDDRHQDHRTISDLTWNTFRRHLILEYEIPKYDGDLGQPNVFVGLTEETMRRKIAFLMRSFATQAEKSWFTEETFLSLARLRGIESPDHLTLAEGFRGRKMPLTFGGPG